MTTPFNSSYNDTTPFSDTTSQFALAANVALPYTVPGDSSMSYRIEFSWAYNANVYVGYRVAATVPTAGTLTSNNNIEFRPKLKYVKGGDILSFISNTIVTDGGFSLLRLP